MSHEIDYSVSREIFDRFPHYVRALVIARGVQNEAGDPGLHALMREAEQSVRVTVRIEDIAEDSRFKPWREAFRWFGAKPSDFRASVEAMARRALRGQDMPQISPLVDIGTIVSLRHLVPIGAHSLDDVSADIQLRLAGGDEIFVPFGSEITEHPSPGEVIFAEESTVLTRRWVWRQANHSLVVPSTKNVVFNVDLLCEASEELIQVICDDLVDLLQKYCGGDIAQSRLSSAQPSIQLRLTA